MQAVETNTQNTLTCSNWTENLIKKVPHSSQTSEIKEMGE